MQNETEDFRMNTLQEEGARRERIENVVLLLPFTSTSLGELLECGKKRGFLFHRVIPRLFFDARQLVLSSPTALHLYRVEEQHGKVCVGLTLDWIRQDRRAPIGFKHVLGLWLLQATTTLDRVEVLAPYARAKDRIVSVDFSSGGRRLRLRDEGTADFFKSPSLYPFPVYIGAVDTVASL